MDFRICRAKINSNLITFFHKVFVILAYSIIDTLREKGVVWSDLGTVTISTIAVLNISIHGRLRQANENGIIAQVYFGSAFFF